MSSEQPLKTKLTNIIEALQEDFIERGTAVRLALLSLLAGEHLLIIGAPGTAKSELARRLHQVMDDGDYFERLLTKFSVPEELFGPLSIKSLEQDRYHRLTKNYLPSANIAFIDEIFKANSAILNSLLTLLNEREFDNGQVREKVPLLSVIGASNELPEEDELVALYDRFLCRYEVQAVSDEKFLTLLTLQERDSKAIKTMPKLSLNVLHDIAQQSANIILPEEVLNLIQSLRMFLAQQKLHVSDRRWRKIIKLLKVSAYTNGQAQVSVWDCFLLQHCLWQVPAQKHLINHWYQSHLGIGSGFNQERLEKLVATWEVTLSDEQSKKVQLKNSLNELLYSNRQGEQTTIAEQYATLEKNGEPLYLAPPDNDDRTNNEQGYTRQALRDEFFDDYYQQCHIDGHWQHIEDYIAQTDNQFRQLLENSPLYISQRYSQSFVDKRVSETQTLYDELKQFSQALAKQTENLGNELSQHLWVTNDFIQQASQSLQETIVAAMDLQQRLKQVNNSFKRLPVEELERSVTNN
ncbi:AAA family ATPase [sulfur-oxidizing endosymbiont of Gigantopelta aegis]|uniref:AAA family ATPase n=1 Tax=sulfur-oxidizing endosymbiont of Gigantopelta aegis TaxID=2794934 RepID=UPI0018DE6F8D|nr:AAA family ATPase [sulfur-oxidizing endosymbiont of Gigantopelta aegis]